MAIPLLKPLYIHFGLTNKALVHFLGVSESTIEKHSSSPEMSWREDTAWKIAELVESYILRLDELSTSRRLAVIDGLRAGVQSFPNDEVRKMISKQLGELN